MRLYRDASFHADAFMPLGMEAQMVLAHQSDENFGRVDIGTSEPLLLDVLINALTQISSECASNIPISSTHLYSHLLMLRV